MMIILKDLKYATLATVSRCGMVWFSDDVISTDMLFSNFLTRLRHISLEDGDDEQRVISVNSKFMAPKKADGKWTSG